MIRVIVEILEKEDKTLEIKSFSQSNVTSTGKEVDASRQYIDRFDQLMRESKGKVKKVENN